MRKHTKQKHEQRSAPIPHVHVGLGRLGIGSVVPFLHLQFPHRPLLLIQRATGWWASLEDNSFCYLKNTAGFFKAYKVWKPQSPGDLDEKINTLPSLAKESILVLVPHIGYTTSLFKTLNRKQTTVSCSVSEGQSELATSLKDVSTKWSRLFLFENTLGGCWKERGLGSKIHHVVVDRICLRLIPDDRSKPSGHGLPPPDTEPKTFPERECVCEKNYSLFQWSKTNSYFHSISKGKKTKMGFCSDDFFEAVPDIRLAARKKRALVNATHAILGILCCRLLANKEMRPEKQYLAPLQALLKNKYPQWDDALDSYIRLRSIEMSLAELEMQLKIGGICSEHCLMVFAKNYRQAGHAHDRFFNTADFLDRLMSGEKLQKEIEKYDEHIVGPFRVFEENRVCIEKHFGFQQPDRAEIIFLKDFLNDSFLQAMKWLSKREHRPTHHP